MSIQAFYKTDRRLGVEVLVQISSCEDRGDFWYVTWRPLLRFIDGTRCPHADLQGAHGASRFYKTEAKGDKFRRAPFKVVDAPAFGIGQIAAAPL